MNVYKKHCTSNYHPLPDAQLDPRAVEEAMNFHTLQNSFHMMSCGKEYPFGHFKSAVLILLPPQLFGPFTANGPDCVQHCLAAAISSSVLPTLFFS